MPPRHESAAVFVPLRDLVPWDRNPRLNDGAVADVAGSIRRFGFTAPIVAWKDRRQIVAGHTRLKAMQSLLAADPAYVPAGCPSPGMVPVRFVDFASQGEADAYALADNKLNELAEWDGEALAGIIRDLSGAEVDLSGLGWTDGELAGFLGAEDDAPAPNADDAGIAYQSKFAVLVHCTSEAHQAAVFERLQADGYDVKVLAL